jgi:hypothetical protein
MLQVDAHDMKGRLLPILRRFEAALVSDKDAEARAKKLGLWAIPCFVGVFASLFLLLASAWFLVLIPILLVTGITLLVKRSRAKRFDLDDVRLATVVRILRMLHVDTPEQSEVTLRIDFRDYMAGGEKTHEEKSGIFGAVKVMKFRHEWFRLAGTLADGTRYELGVIDCVGRKEKRKRKYTKVKAATRSTVELQLRLRATKYKESVQSVADVLSAAAPPRPLAVKALAASGLRLRVVLQTPVHVHVKGRYAPTEVGAENRLSGDMLLQTMLWAYNGIGQSLAKSA